jgi:hypothetical protein
MPNSELFTYVYQVTGGTAGGVMNVGTRYDASSPGSSGPYTLSDGRDGAVDGTTTLGDLVYYIDSSGTYQAQVIALADGDDPIIQFLSGGGTWIVSNNPSLPQGGTVNTSNTGSYIYCFLGGTRIMTPQGEIEVERLAIGEPVLTAEGAPVPVKWIGCQTVSTFFGPAERLMPVRISAGALGNGLPHSDLTVTADHGMLVEGVICHAGALVNGETITRVPLSEMGESFSVYHIETEEHEIILANGAPAETFIDNVSRRVFDNYAEFEALYGDVPEMEELPYPRAMSARQVPGWIARSLAIRKMA